MALYVDYTKPIGLVRYHYDTDNGKKSRFLPIYQCNGLFAIVYNKSQLIMFACDTKHFSNCLIDNLYDEFTEWTLCAEISQSRGMMLQLIKHNIPVIYVSKKSLTDKLKSKHLN